jgi:hypothetical protein
MFITDVNDTGKKLFCGVNDTGEKFIAGVVDTGNYSLSRIFSDRRCR